MKKKITYLSNIRLLLIAVIVLQLSGCKKDDSEEGKIDKTALLIGTWSMTETSDRINAPVKLLYSFEEDGTFIYTITVRNGKPKSIISATWRFTDADQTQLELTLDTVTIHTIELLDETTLKLNDGQVVLTFTKQ